MTRRPADLLEVVVLAGDAEAALVVDGAPVRPLLGAGQGILELDHPGVREEQRLVAGRDETGARDDRVASLGEELDEPPPDLVGGQRSDPRIAVEGRAGHAPNGTEQRIGAEESRGRSPRTRRPASGGRTRDRHRSDYP